MAREPGKRKGAEMSVGQKSRSGGEVALRVSPAGLARPLAIPVGGTSLSLGADASGAMGEMAPTFGAVLSSIGAGVATSQALLDRSVIETVNNLAKTNITVVSEVIEELNEDGLPDAEKTTLVEQSVSVLNYVMPTVHEWKHVALTMDMQVSRIDNETGIEVDVRKGQSESGNYGLFFGMLGVGYYHGSSSYQSMLSTSHYESQWAQGQINMDAVLGPRPTTKFPVPTTVSIGPQIYLSQGGVLETRDDNDVLTARSVDVLISVRRQDGSPNPGKTIRLDPAGLMPLPKDEEDGYDGLTTNDEGQCLVTFTRDIPNPAFSRPSRRTITVSLGSISQTLVLTI